MRCASLKIAVASASKNASDVITHLELWEPIDALCDGYSVNLAKPAPDLFLCAAEKLGIPPSECVVVEDAGAGIDAAQAAGMLSVGLGPVERVGQADLVLPHLEISLQQILAGLDEEK
jgi:kojibiose phosphorylase